jgi:histidyl-tRNA synthetase
MNFKRPRGTADILPEDQPYWGHVYDVASKVANQFGYHRIDTPMFEDTNLFERGVGNETDIVQKEMYSFEDHGGDLITLRPEGTASVCRAYIENGLHNLPQPVRMYYAAAMFRYERPQAGRVRQFHQFGVEAIGDASPEVDAEIIELGWKYIADLGIKVEPTTSTS